MGKSKRFAQWLFDHAVGALIGVYVGLLIAGWTIQPSPLPDIQAARRSLEVVDDNIGALAATLNDLQREFATLNADLQAIIDSVGILDPEGHHQR